jgi:hypothetical protein
MTLNHLTEIHKQHREGLLFGRYITQEMIAPILEKLGNNFVLSVIGYSVESRPIHSIKLGTGKTKVLLWSQMHGNESTTTKALFDVLNVFKSKDLEFDALLKSCTLLIIPILNPDGAHLYTRLNANKVDLNRDAQDLSQPESVVLRDCFESFQPHFCLNLHGQRTIFSAGNTSNSSTLSFLAPSQDAERTVTKTRQKAMSMIVEIKKELHGDLPGAIGRYEDDFNINCVGDTFQSFNVPTLLFEAGHYKYDYSREETRLFMFKSLFYGLYAIAHKIDSTDYKLYFTIPENKKIFHDVIIRNVKLDSSNENTVDIAIQFKEKLVNDNIEFIPIIEKLIDLPHFFGHKEIDGNNAVALNHLNKRIYVGDEILFVILNNCKFLLKP